MYINMLKDDKYFYCRNLIFMTYNNNYRCPIHVPKISTVKIMDNVI